MDGWMDTASVPYDADAVAFTGVHAAGHYLPFTLPERRIAAIVAIVATRQGYSFERVRRGWRRCHG